MIVVFGATGNVGREVVAALVAAKEQVRAVTRDPARAAFDAGVEVVAVDVAQPGTVLDAVTKADAVFVLSAGNDAAAQDAAVADAVRRTGPARVVKVSSVAALPPVETSYGRLHADAEAVLREAAPACTVLRPASYMSNVYQWVWTVKSESTVYGTYGDLPRALVDPRDVAGVAVRALLSPGHEGRTYTLTGPRALTTAEQVDRLGAALGRALRYVDMPPSAARDTMVNAGMDATLVEGILAAQGDPDPARGGVPLPTVAELTGRSARPFEDWLAEHVEVFR